MHKLLTITVSGLLSLIITTDENFGMQLKEKYDTISNGNTITTTSIATDKSGSTNSDLLFTFTINSKQELLYSLDVDIKNALNKISKRNKIWKLIDVEKLISKIKKRTNMIKKNKTNQLTDYSFSEIQVPLKGYLYKTINRDDCHEDDLCNIEIEHSKSVMEKNLNEKKEKILAKYENKDLKENFIREMQTLFNNNTSSLWNVFENKKMNWSWHISVKCKEKFPELIFISDTTLLCRNENYIVNEKELSRLMSTIKMDLNTNPYLRRNGVPLNTRLLFNYFLKPGIKNLKQNDDFNASIIKNVNRYQKYLTDNENNVLTLQLLSILYPKWLLSYKKNNFVSTLFDKYMIVITERLFYNIDYKHITHYIKPKNTCLTEMFQKFLHEQLIWEGMYSESIDNFTYKVINNKNKITLYNMCSKKLEAYLKEPVRAKFIKLYKEFSNKNEDDTQDPRFKNFVCAMCKGNTGILNIVMNFFSPYNICKFRKIMYILPFNNK